MRFSIFVNEHGGPKDIFPLTELDGYQLTAEHIETYLKTNGLEASQLSTSVWAELENAYVAFPVAGIFRLRDLRLMEEEGEELKPFSSDVRRIVLRTMIQAQNDLGFGGQQWTAFNRVIDKGLGIRNNGRDDGPDDVTAEEFEFDLVRAIQCIGEAVRDIVIQLNDRNERGDVVKELDGVLGKLEQRARYLKTSNSSPLRRRPR
jgi:hypothetical protein